MDICGEIRWRPLSAVPLKTSAGVTKGTYSEEKERAFLHSENSRAGWLYTQLSKCSDSVRASHVSHDAVYSDVPRRNSGFKRNNRLLESVLTSDVAIVARGTSSICGSPL